MAQFHMQRVGANLITNPTVNGSSGWSLSGFGTNAVYDSTISRSADGSGSIKLPYVHNAIPTATSAVMPVTPNTQYTFACYIRSGPTRPGHYTLDVHMLDASQNTLPSNGGIIATGHKNSGPNIWEEAVMLVMTHPNARFVRFAMGRWENKNNINPPNGTIGEIPGAGDLWADDFYVGTGWGFEQPPTPRVAFNGGRIKVAAEGGAMQRFNGTTWEDFLPISVFDRPNGNDYAKYANQGFNCSAWVVNSLQMSKLRAVGMFGFVYISPYLNGFWDRHHIGDQSGSNANFEVTKAKFAETLQGFLAAGDEPYILGWYHDQEVDWSIWQDWIDIVAMARAWETTNFGGARSPQLTLHGLGGVVRAYRNTGWPINVSDVVFTYVEGGAGTGGAGGAREQFTYILNQQNQIVPAIMAQMNTKTNLRTHFYKSTCQGCYGLSYYIDSVPGTGPVIETMAWWNSFPTLVAEMQALIPFLKAPPQHRTWTMTANKTAQQIQIGGRDVNGEGHIMMMNLTAGSYAVTFTLAGVGYTLGAVKDFFTGTTITNVVGGQFTVTLPGVTQTTGHMVLRLENLSGGSAPVGTIESPVGPVTIDIDGSVDLQGSFAGGSGTTTHLWDILEAGHGTTLPSTLADPGVIGFPNGGTWTLTYTVTDSVDGADTMPPTRVITVASNDLTVINPETTPALAWGAFGGAGTIRVFVFYGGRKRSWDAPNDAVTGVVANGTGVFNVIAKSPLVLPSGVIKFSVQAFDSMGDPLSNETAQVEFTNP